VDCWVGMAHTDKVEYILLWEAKLQRAILYNLQFGQISPYMIFIDLVEFSNFMHRTRRQVLRHTRYAVARPARQSRSLGPAW
jgi:hypothetical protein